uniref:Tetraspanin-19 n=1 Tax=Kalanchoe fedtschenkoi TaxID=63787 RepID=A0A7N0ULT7_KALFE
MGSVVRSCTQSFLKLANSVIGMVGLAMIFYGLWLIRAWNIHMDDSPFDFPDSLAPWFIYAFLGTGVILCVITCSGHLAAATANGFCLYLYMLFIFLIFLAEAAVTFDIFVNHNWEEDFPDDPSGSFDKFKDFIRSNFSICKWIGLSIVSVQGLCMLLALILKALGPQRYYDSDDEIDPTRLPLLQNNGYRPSYAIGDPVYGTQSNGWRARATDHASK